MVKRLGVFLMLFFATLAFQNCSNVNFDSPSTDVASKTDAQADIVRDPDEVVTDNEDEVIDEVVRSNPACDLFKENASHDLGGQDFTHNGVTDKVSVANGNKVRVNGLVYKVAVNGAKEVQNNGVVSNLCLKGEKITVNGLTGLSGVPTVLMGQGNNAQITHLNGVNAGDLAIINIKNIGALNGLTGDTYIYGGRAESISGAGFDLHLMKGTHVERINGLFHHIYLYDGSTIGRLNGSSKLIRVKAK